MTAMESLSIVHSEQGFLIMACHYEHPDMEIIRTPTSVWTKDEHGYRPVAVTHPVQVIGPATRAEFLRQNSRLASLIGCPDDPNCVHRCFYRVIALD